MVDAVENTFEVDESEAENQERIRSERLDAFGLSMARSRSEAIGARQTSGIEDIWREDEEFYEGVDDLNRGDERSMTRYKPPQGGGGSSLSRQHQNQSRVFPNITGPFVDSAAAHIADILLPTDDRPWSFKPTPIPELQELADSYVGENPDVAKQDKKKGFLTRVKDMLANPNRNDSELRDENLVDQGTGMSPEEAFQQTELARAIAEAIQTRVWDWQVESQFNAEVRKVIEDAAQVGVGVIKGPVPRSDQTITWQAEATDDNGVVTAGHIVTGNDLKPSSHRIDYWNLYPAVGCGDNIQNGDYIWERDYLTKKQLRKLKLDDTYQVDQINKCLSEGPVRAVAEAPETHSVSASDEMQSKYEVWYRYGSAELEDLSAAGCDCTDIVDPHIECLVVMVNSRVIKASLPTTDFGGYPYDVFCWRNRKNYWAGIGVSRQARTAQKIVVGATRSMMNNAGLAGGPMIVFKQGAVRPADGVAGLGPRKVFYISKDDETIADATKAIGVIKVDIMVNEMLAIINFGLQIAESETGFPMLMQGQMGRAPDRVGIVNVLDKNTNAIKRRVARNFSDALMHPHLYRYYIYHLMYGPDNEKGDIQVSVKGYSSLVERDIQNEQLGQVGSIVVDPRFGLDPKKWAEEYLKSRHLNPSDLKLDDQEWEEMLNNWQSMMEAGGGDSDSVKVATINAQSRLQGTQLKGQFDSAKQESSQAYDASQNEIDRQMVLVQGEIASRLEELKRQGVSDDIVKKLKVDLSKEVMKINSVFKLANMKAPASAMPKPAFEPAGRAPAGESYQK